MRIVQYNQPSYRSAFASRLGGEVGRFFAPFAGGFAVELYEDKDNTYVRAELPGVDRANLEVELADESLDIRVKRKAAEGEQEDAVVFGRSVSVPAASTIQADKVAATYENGVLTVTLPKRDEVKPRKIAIS